MKTNNMKRIWIDLDNSPHVLFFTPIIDELDKRGYHVVLTTRDCFQVSGLADLHGLDYRRIGRHYGKNKVLKLLGLVIRAVQLMPIAIKEKPAVALSHGSRSQMLASSILGRPSILVSDYEYSRFLPMSKPKWLIMPEVIVDSPIQLDIKHILTYPGIKEDVYVSNFRPTFGLRRELGIREDDLMATVRPPATEAHYHNPESESLFKEVVDYLCAQKSNVRIVMLPRNESQADQIMKLWPEQIASGVIIIPRGVVNGLNLMWHSDLVISGGGTMNREAAAMRIPVYSIFRGKIGAVDRYLADTGRLILIESFEDVRKKIKLIKRVKSGNPKRAKDAALQSILNSIIAVIEGTP